MEIRTYSIRSSNPLNSLRSLFTFDFRPCVTVNICRIIRIKVYTLSNIITCCLPTVCSKRLPAIIRIFYMEIRSLAIYTISSRYSLCPLSSLNSLKSRPCIFCWICTVGFSVINISTNINRRSFRHLTRACRTGNTAVFNVKIRSLSTRTIISFRSSRSLNSLITLWTLKSLKPLWTSIAFISGNDEWNCC